MSGLYNCVATDRLHVLLFLKLSNAGAGAGDDEVISVKLGAVPDDVVALFFTVNVFTNGKTFNDVEGE